MHGRQYYTVLNLIRGQAPVRHLDLGDVSSVNHNVDSTGGVSINPAILAWRENIKDNAFLYEQAYVVMGEGCSVEFYNRIAEITPDHKNRGIYCSEKDAWGNDVTAIMTVLQPDYGLRDVIRHDMAGWKFEPLKNKPPTNISNQRVMFKINDSFYDVEVARSKSVIMASPIGCLTTESGKYVSVYDLNEDVLDQLDQYGSFLVSAYKIHTKGITENGKAYVGHAILTPDQYIDGCNFRKLKEKSYIDQLSSDDSGIFTLGKVVEFDKMRQVVLEALFQPISAHHLTQDEYQTRDKRYIRIFFAVLICSIAIALEVLAGIYQLKIAIGATTVMLWIAGVVVISVGVITYGYYEFNRYCRDKTKVFEPGESVIVPVASEEFAIDAAGPAQEPAGISRVSSSSSSQYGGRAEQYEDSSDEEPIGLAGGYADVPGEAAVVGEAAL